MLDPFISKEVVVEGRKQFVIPLPRIRGIRPYALFQVLRQFRRMQTTPREVYYGAYVYDIGDDKVHEASEMMRGWKCAKKMDKDTISLDQFNVGYDESYKVWLRDNIQSISSPIPHIFSTS